MHGKLFVIGFWLASMFSLLSFMLILHYIVFGDFLYVLGILPLNSWDFLVDEELVHICF